MQIEVTRDVLKAMMAAAKVAHHDEACGLLLGDGEQVTSFWATRNVHPAPQTHFEIDPQALIDAYRAEREGGPQVMGYFHSHPAGQARPSATDQAQSARDGKIWSIAAGKDLLFWRDDPSGFAALPFTVIDH